MSLDQVGVIAERAGDGSDAHYALLAESATVTQLRTAIKLEPRPDPDPGPRREPERSIIKTGDDKYAFGGSSFRMPRRRRSMPRWRRTATRWSRTGDATTPRASGGRPGGR